jgi:hypothetical protein
MVLWNVPNFLCFPHFRLPNKRHSQRFSNVLVHSSFFLEIFKKEIEKNKWLSRVLVTIFQKKKPKYSFYFHILLLAKFG